MPAGTTYNNLRKRYHEIVRENAEIFESGKYTNPAGDIKSIEEWKKHAVDTQVTYKPTYIFKTDGRENNMAGEFEITGETTVGASYRLRVTEGIERTVALNFANPEEIGGGYLRGAIAQEECICRTSGLYHVLSTQTEMYDNAILDPIFTDYMILSQNVPVFRGDDYEFLENPFPADFITCAAPYAYGVKNRERSNNALEIRTRKVIMCAIENGYDAIVLGAFGCGAFGNSIHDFAKMVRKILIEEGLRFYFKKITFAIYSRTNENAEVIGQELAKEGEKE